MKARRRLRPPSRGLPIFVSEALVAQPTEGAQSLAHTLGRHLRGAHRSRLWGPEAGSTEEAERWLKRGWPGWSTLWALWRERPAHLIYLPGNGSTVVSFLRTLLFLFASRPRSMDVVVTQIHWHPPMWISKRMGSLTFVAVSPVDRERLGAHARVLGLRRPPLPARVEPKSEVRARLGLSSDPVFLHVGHARRGRRLHSLSPLSEFGTVQLVLSSYGDEEHDAVPPETDRLRVHRGYCSTIEDFYASADVYVFPVVSRANSIGIPVSILEAVATGLPVVARRTGATQQLDPVPGVWLVDDDEEMVRTAAGLATGSAGGPGAGMLMPDTRCGDDLSVCRGTHELRGEGSGCTSAP